MWRLLFLLPAFALGCGEPASSRACQDSHGCAATQICQSGKCVEVASPECRRSSDCVTPPPGQSAQGALCWGGACHYLAAAGADSFSLIEQARDGGYLDEGTALLYQTYAAFGDARLPEAYRGTTPVLGDAMVLAAVRHEWESLDANTRALLQPFLLPPAADGSWLELREATAGASSQPLPNAAKVQWRTVDSAAGIRIWYQPRYDGDDAKAAGLAEAAAAPILGRLDETMSARWLSDDGFANNGGDGRLDVYLVRGIDVYGLTTPYADCQMSPAWIIVDSQEPLGDDATPGLVQTLAHEWLHAVQMALPYQSDCRQYFWLFEMTAVWFEDAVYPDANSEHMFAKSYLDSAYWSLDGTASARWYGEYLFPFFLTRVLHYGRSFVGTVFANAASMEPLDALDDDGRFDLYWGDFVRANWNRPPDEDYRTVDGLTVGITPFNPQISMTPNLRQLLPAQLPHLTAMYYDLKFDDDAARAVFFHNGLDYVLSEQTGGLMGDDVRIDGDPISYEEGHGLSVQAFIKRAGEDWTAEDWTYGRIRSFCRDVKAQRVEEVVLAVGNGEHKKDARNWVLREHGLPLQVITSDIACWRWSGTLSRSIKLDHGSDELTADVVWELDDPDNFWEYQAYKLVSGHVTYHNDSSDPDTGCQESADDSFDLGAGEDDSFLSTASGIIGGGRERSYYGYARSSHEVTFHGGCPDPDQGWITFTDDVTLGLWWSTRAWLPHQSDAGGPLPVFDDPTHMDGEYTDKNVTYRWHLTAEPEE